MKTFSAILACVAFSAVPSTAVSGSEAAAGEATAGKSGYTLRNPTPRALLRQLSTDRPDKTESPYTVDAGHYQFEMDLVSYTHDRDKFGGVDTRTRAWAVAPVNLKVGLLNDLDLQFIIETYNHLRTEDRGDGTSELRSGFGDITLRLKKNFWGNDGGRTAFAIMPFIKFPSNQENLGNNALEGGAIFPLAVELPAGWGMGLMTEVDFLRNDDDKGYHASFINLITLGHDIYGDLAGYVEFYSEVSTERRPRVVTAAPHRRRWIGTMDLGLTYGLTGDIQLDAGVNNGITKSADDLNPFVGLSLRF